MLKIFNNNYSIIYSSVYLCKKENISLFFPIKMMFWYNTNNREVHELSVIHKEHDKLYAKCKMLFLELFKLSVNIQIPQNVKLW